MSKIDTPRTDAIAATGRAMEFRINVFTEAVIKHAEELERELFTRDAQCRNMRHEHEKELAAWKQVAGELADQLEDCLPEVRFYEGDITAAVATLSKFNTLKQNDHS